MRLRRIGGGDSRDVEHRGAYRFCLFWELMALSPCWSTDALQRAAHQQV